MVPGLHTAPYVFERTHALLARDIASPDGPNIGRRGANLTICLLSLNRSALSLRLLSSIRQHLPDFAGEVLIVDNGSEAAELDALRGGCSNMPFRCRIVELGRNYGVAGGRNRAMPHVATEWVLSLDNDIYFTANPLPNIQRDIALLGCHFLNVPLLDRDAATVFSRGGHLYLQIIGDAVSCGGGSVYPQQAAGPEMPAFLSTFLLGGASVLNKATFEQVGGYDEGMFIGFEDIDFSIRLHQLGYKIGNTGVLALVHDHPPPAAEDDKDYERQRFSRALLRKSAEHLEAKHGFKIWSDGVDGWLRQRQCDLGLGQEADPQSPGPREPVEITQVSRPRIALMVDIEGWAFWNISQQLRRHLGDRYEFNIIETTVVDNVARLFFMSRGCDVLHFFWREYLGLILKPHWAEYLRDLGLDQARFTDRFVRPRVISTCIYDHLHAAPAELQERLPMYRELVDIYYVGSNRLAAFYRQAAGYPPPAAVLEDGVDLERFGPRGLERFNAAGGRELVVGWVGNSNWGDGREDYKGVRTILRPAIEELRSEGLPVRAEILDRARSALVPHNEMPAWYQGIDVYVCTSLIEGTPNPILEAMACGVPVVTTDVGVVPEAFGPRQAEFILPERSIEAFKTALRRLIREPHLLPVLSAENLEHIRAWDWAVKTEKFHGYFQECLARKAPRSASA